jgi:hypothetical protein
MANRLTGKTVALPNPPISKSRPTAAAARLGPAVSASNTRDPAGIWLLAVIDHVWKVASIPFIGTKTHLAPADNDVRRTIRLARQSQFARYIARHHVGVVVGLTKRLQPTNEKIASPFVKPDFKLSGSRVESKGIAL